MKLSLYIPIKDLKGADVPGLSLSDLVANALVSGNSGQPAKAFSVASRLIEKGEVDLDKPDLDFVKTVVQGSNAITDLVKYRFLEAVEKLDKAP